MDVKMIHDMLEKITECAKCELEEKGIENINTKEFGEVADIIKDLASALYHRTITVAMDESEYGEDYDWEGRKGYRGQPRDSRGRYMSRRGRRMGYEESPYYHMHMMPDYDMEDMDYMGHMRDMDRKEGKMYYTEPMRMGDMKYEHDAREGRSGKSRKGYMEAKEMHRGNTTEDKQHKMKELEKYMSELGTDITEMISDASPEEKNMLKGKLQTLVTKI